MRQQRLAVILFSASGLVAHGLVQAQVQRSGGGGETQKIMQQYQQVAAEKTALQGQVAQLKKDLEAANSQIAAVKKERDVAKAHTGIPPAALAQATSAREAAEHNLELSKQRMTELVTRFRDTATNLKDVEADRSKLRKDLAYRNTAYDQCAADNMKLYDLNGEILNRLEHVGLFTKASATEPFTKITRTRLDNLAVEYRERAQAMKLKPAMP
jgi:chromosome segregation ATPase